MLGLIAAAYVSATPFVTVRRYGCLPNPCPEYTIDVFDDGRVQYDGDAHVATTGRAFAQLTVREVAALRALFEEVGFLKLSDELVCSAECTDQQTTKLLYRSKGREREIVHDYGCVGDKTLERLTKLEERFDALVGADRWVRSRP